MNRTNLSQKVKILERDISEIKKYLGVGIPKEKVNFDIDLKNWQKIKRTVKKIREELFKERYPRLYAKLKKIR